MQLEASQAQQSVAGYVVAQSAQEAGPSTKLPAVQEAVHLVAVQSMQEAPNAGLALQALQVPASSYSPIAQAEAMAKTRETAKKILRLFLIIFLI